MIAGYVILGAIILVGVFLGWKTLFSKREGFEEMIVSGNTLKATKEMCVKLKAGIDQYTQLRKEHPDVEIRNLNETLETMKEHYTKYGCDTYTY